MAKASKKELDETTRIMGKLASMPHKPHVAKKAAKKVVRKKKPAK